MQAEYVPEVLSELSRKRREAKASRRMGHFIKGPLPMPWLERAARLPGKALAVALLLWFMAGMVGGAPIKLSAGLLARFGVGRKAAYAALTALEREGLITAQRRRGRLPSVKIRSPLASG
jgi:DNA-binding transcriptional ArsR family regulator